VVVGAVLEEGHHLVPVPVFPALAHALALAVEVQDAAKKAATTALSAPIEKGFKDDNEI